MIRTSTLFLIVLLVVLLSCEEKTDWQLDAEEVDLIVVDGLITDEYKKHLVKLTKPVKELNEQAELVTGAQVSVFDGVAYHPLYEFPANSGNYYSDSAAAGINRSYLLEVRHAGNYYSAESGMVPVEGFVPLEYEELEDSADFFKLSSNPEIFNSDNPCMWQIWVSWDFLPEYQNMNKDSCVAKIMAYTLPSIDVPQIFKPNKAEVIFPKGSLIVQKKYSLTGEHAEFLRTMLSETEWRGGLFDVMPANVSTNLSEGAIGFFGVCAVKTDTIWVY